MIDTLSKWVEKAYRWVMFFFSAGILTLFVCYKLIATSVLVRWEHAIHIQNSIMPCLIGLILLLAAGFLFASSKAYPFLSGKLKDDRFYFMVRRGLLFGIFLISAGWVICTQFVPGVDEGETMHYAYLAYQGNFDQFRSGGYLQQYPNQWGLFLLEYLMIRIFGGQNYLAFELFNAFAIVAIVYELSEIARINGSGRLVEVGVMLLGLLFLPLEFYAIYVYGNIFSMAFALAAVKNQMLFTRNLKIRNASLCAVEISLAVWLKSTIEIYLVAIVIYAVVDILVNRRNGFWKRVLFLVLVAAAFYLQSAGTRAVIQKMTGMELSNPISMVSYVAMGLQEAEAGPGWWNGYNRESYYASGNNTELQTQMALDNIRESVRVFCQSPGYALSFFTRKITSTWMNPTFQCFATVRNNVFIYLPEWVQNLLTYGGQYSISKYLNVLLFLIYTGSLADIVYLYIHREYTERSILIMAFVGGVVFLLFWETKARYALMFLVCLFPYAVDGYRRIICTLLCLSQRIRAKEKLSFRVLQRKRCAFPCVIISLVVVLFLIVYAPRYSKILTPDTDNYVEYLVTHGKDSVVPDIVKTKYS